MIPQITAAELEAADAYGRAVVYGGPGKFRKQLDTLRSVAGGRWGAVLGSAAIMHYKLLRVRHAQLVAHIHRQRDYRQRKWPAKGTAAREGITSMGVIRVTRDRSIRRYCDYVPWMSDYLMRAGVPREALRCPCGRGSLLYRPGQCTICASRADLDKGLPGRFKSWQAFTVRHRSGERVEGRTAAEIAHNHFHTAVTIY